MGDVVGLTALRRDLPALVIGRNSERVVVDIWGLRLPVRGAGQSGVRRSLCLRAENLAITASGSGIRGRVTGAAYHDGWIIPPRGD